MIEVVRCSVAMRKQRKQNTRESSDCSDIDAVKPPVETRTSCQRLEEGVVGVPVVFGEIGDVNPLTDFSEGCLYPSNYKLEQFEKRRYSVQLSISERFKRF